VKNNRSIIFNYQIIYKALKIEHVVPVARVMHGSQGNLNHNFLRSKIISMHFYLQQGLTKQNIHREKNRRGRIWPGCARSGPDWPSRLAGQPGRGPKRYGVSAVRLGSDRRPSAVVLVRCCMRARRAAWARVSRGGGSPRSSRSGEGLNWSSHGRGRRVQAQILHAEARVGSRAPPVFRRLRQWRLRLPFSCTKSRAGEI
jgi:hypothetical protein